MVITDLQDIVVTTTYPDHLALSYEHFPGIGRE